MNNIIKEFNNCKKEALKEKIKKCKECNEEYRLFCIDVDGVVFNTDPVVQEIIEKIDYRATKKYIEQLSHENTEDMRESIDKSFDILDAILEETRYVEYDEEKLRTVIHDYKRLNYDEIYVKENLIPGSVECIREMIKNREKNDFFIFLSHRNPEREGMTKARVLYELVPEIDAVETLPFHKAPGSKIVTSKALWIKEKYELDSINNCYLIDDTKKNGFDFRKNGGIDIRYLLNGFNESHTLADHMSKLANLDPYMIQFAISYIEFSKNNPYYINEVDISMAESHEKVKKL